MFGNTKDRNEIYPLYPPIYCIYPYMEIYPLWEFRTHFFVRLNGICICEKQTLSSLIFDNVHLLGHVLTCEMFRNVPKCSEMFRNVPKCSEMFRNVPKCSEMFRNVPKCSEMFRNVPKCSEMFRNVLKCSEMF